MVLCFHSAIHLHGVMLNCLSTGIALPFWCVTFSSSVPLASLRFTWLVIRGFHVLRSQRDLPVRYPLSVSIAHMDRSTVTYFLQTSLRINNDVILL
jgi:hypothetical protein